MIEASSALKAILAWTTPSRVQPFFNVVTRVGLPTSLADSPYWSHVQPGHQEGSDNHEEENGQFQNGDSLKGAANAVTDVIMAQIQGRGLLPSLWAKLHFNSSTITGLVEQCRREPPLTIF
jgi:hypothetical protein